jgi:hypothetical protein
MTDRATIEASKPSCTACGRKCEWDAPYARWVCAVHGPIWSAQMAGRMQRAPAEDEAEAILRDPEFMHGVRAGLDDAAAGRLVSFEDVFDEPL